MKRTMQLVFLASVLVSSTFTLAFGHGYFNDSHVKAVKIHHGPMIPPDPWEGEGPIIKAPSPPPAPPCTLTPPYFCFR